jgi:hypothetical protein
MSVKQDEEINDLEEPFNLHDAVDYLANEEAERILNEKLSMERVRRILDEDEGFIPRAAI